MTVLFERRVAWLFAGALKRCFDRPATRADATPAQIRLSKDGLTMHASAPEIAVIYTQPGPTGNGVFTFPVSHFHEFEGKTDEPVEIALQRPNLARASWEEKGRTREMEIPLVEPESVAIVPQLPKRFMPLPAHFLAALHEAIGRRYDRAAGEHNIGASGVVWVATSVDVGGRPAAVCARFGTRFGC